MHTPVQSVEQWSSAVQTSRASSQPAANRPARQWHKRIPAGPLVPCINDLHQPSGRLSQGLCASSSDQASRSVSPQPASRVLLTPQRPTPPADAQAIKPSWVSAPLIMRRIKAADTWLALREVLEDHQMQFNHIHISAALLQYTKLRGHPAADTAKAYSPQPATGPTGPVAAATPDTAHAANPPRDPLLRQLLSMVVQELDTFDVRGVSNTIYALATLQHHDTGLLQSLLTSVQYRMDMGTPQNLANIIWSTVTLGHTPEREWMALYYDAIDARIPSFNPQDIANTLWAFGRLQFNGMQYKVAPDIIRQLLQQAYPQLADFLPQHLANSAWGLARLGFAPNPAWCQAFLTVSQYSLATMHVSEVISMVWAVNRLRMRPGEAWLDAVVKASLPWLQTLSMHQLSQLVVSMGGMGAHPPPAWLARALASARARMAEHSPVSLSTMLTGVAMLGGPGAAGLDARQAEAWLEGHLEVAWGMLGSATSTNNSIASNSSNNAPDASSASSNGAVGSTRLTASSNSMHIIDTGGMNGTTSSADAASQHQTASSSFQVLYPPSDRQLPAPRAPLFDLSPQAPPSQAQHPVADPQHPFINGHTAGGSSRDGVAIIGQAGGWNGNGVGPHAGAAESHQPMLAPQPGMGRVTDSAADDDYPQGRFESWQAADDGEETARETGWPADGSSRGQYTACQFSPDELGRVLYALATMQLRLPPERLEQVYAVLEESPGLLEGIAISDKTMSLVLWSLMQLQQLSSGAVAAQQQQAQPGQEVAVDGSQQEGLQQSQPVQPDLQQPAGQAPEQHQQQQQQVLAGSNPRFSSRRLLSAQQQPQLQRLFTATLPRPLMWRLAQVTGPMLRRRYGPLELSLLLRAFALQPDPPPDRWMAYYWWRSLVLLGSASGMPPAALVSQLASLVRLQQPPHSTWWKGALGCAQKAFPSFTAAHFSGFLRHVAQLGHMPDDAWCQRYLLATYRVWNELRPHHWEQILWALARLQVKVPSAWMHRYFTSSQSQLPLYTANQLACIGWAVGKLGTRPPRAWAHAYQEATKPQLRQLQPAQLVRCVAGLSRIARAPQVSWVAEALVVVRKAAQNGVLLPEQEQMLAMALQRLKLRIQEAAAQAAAAAAAAAAATAAAAPTAAVSNTAATTNNGNGSGSSSGQPRNRRKGPRVSSRSSPNGTEVEEIVAPVTDAMPVTQATLGVNGHASVPPGAAITPAELRATMEAAAPTANTSTPAANGASTASTAVQHPAAPGEGSHPLDGKEGPEEEGGAERLVSSRSARRKARD